MRIDIITIFPDFFKGPFSHSIVKIAQEKNKVEINIHDRIESSFPVLDVFVKVACFIARGGNLTVIGKETFEFKKLIEKKNKLFKELDSLLVETYQTSSVLIDDARLVAGEEGCLCTLDIEFIKNDNRVGLFDPRKMSNTVKENILKKLENLEEVIKNSHKN